MLSLADTHFSFRLRIAFEADLDDPQSPLQLRGSLQRLDLDEVRYFSSLEGLPKILKELIERTNAPGADQRGE